MPPGPFSIHRGELAMAMIPSNYEMNIAYHGQHWAKVEFGHDTLPESVERKARQIAHALRSNYGDHSKWSFSLSKIECAGYEIKAGLENDDDRRI